VTGIVEASAAVSLGEYLRRGKPAPQGPASSPNLDRVGLAKHEEKQSFHDKSLMQILSENRGDVERLIRSMPQIEHVLRDLRKGLRDKSNSINVKHFDTAAAPATNTGAGIMFRCHEANGGVPWNAFTILSVGGAGTTMDVSINDSDWIPGVAAGDREENLEIWKIAFRVRTGGAGTATVMLYSYIPGIGGLKGVQ
jgi:hypothetical protein